MQWKSVENTHYYHNEDGAVFAYVLESRNDYPNNLYFLVKDDFFIPQYNLCFGIENSKKYIERLYSLLEE